MRRLTLTMLVGLWASAASAAERPPVDQWQLDNGLKVVFMADHKAPVVTVQVFYHAGGKDEPPDKRGIAHMFEHMMFKGSAHVPPEEHARFIDLVGGENNAFTADDVTGYHDTVPPAALDFALKLEAERMRNLKLTQKTIDSEREVVKEELRVSLENNPVQQALDKLLRLAYTVHPYRIMPIGEKAMLDTITVADCQRFYDRYYRPNNATVIVVGDTDVASVRAMVARHFGALERGLEVTHDAPVEPPQQEARAATLTLPVRLPVLVGGYHIPDGASADRYPLEVLQQVLSGGESSRLYQRLVRRDRSAVAAGGVVFAHEDPGLFITYAAYLPTADVGKIKAALAEEIARVADVKVNAKELQKAKSQLAARAVYTRERVSDIASAIGVDGVEAHDALRTFTAPARYDAVSADDLVRVARKYLVQSNFSQVTLQAPGGAK